MASAMGAKRLQMEYISILKRKDLENFIAQPSPLNIFEWHFVIFGLADCPYENGYYHGSLSFPKEYPFKPPRIRMLTPSGRFQVNTPICMSFSDFHPEMWSSNWGVSTIVIGLISFMCAEEMTTGGMRVSHAQRLAFAKASIAYNIDPLKNPKFTKIFAADTLDRIGCSVAAQKRKADIVKRPPPKTAATLESSQSSISDGEGQASKQRNFLIFAGFLLLVAYLIATYFE